MLLSKRVCTLIHDFLALMLLVFTTRHMVRSAHLTLVLEKVRDGLISHYNLVVKTNSMSARISYINVHTLLLKSIVEKGEMS